MVGCQSGCASACLRVSLSICLPNAIDLYVGVSHVNKTVQREPSRWHSAEHVRLGGDSNEDRLRKGKRKQGDKNDSKRRQRQQGQRHETTKTSKGHHDKDSKPQSQKTNTNAGEGRGHQQASVIEKHQRKMVPKFITKNIK